VTVQPFLLLAALTGTLSLLLRAERAWSTAVAALGLALMTGAATAMSGSAVVEIGGSTLAASEWLRLFAILGSLVGLLLVAVDVTAEHEPDVPGTIALGLGASVLALATPDPRLGVVAATAGGLVGVLVAAPIGAAARAAVVGVREVRALAVAGALAIVATAWLARPLDDLESAPAVFGFAYLAFAVAVAIRFGAIPFHLWAARVADAAPGVALPLLLAWAPAAFAAVALTWIDQSVAPLALPLTGEQSVIASIGAVSVVLGIVAAAVQDDLEHVVGYTIAADAGFVVLGLAAFDPSVWEPSRTWLLVFVVVRSALAAWVVALHGGFGSRRLSELSGWARRAPLLAVALILIGTASIGWPGTAGWDARADLASLALSGPFALIATLMPLAAVAIYARFLLIGLGRPSRAVLDGRGDRPGWPAPWPSRPMVGLGTTERLFERGAHAIGGGLDVLWVLPAAFRRNRMPLASVAVLTLAVLGWTVAAGGLGVPRAARAVPTIGQPNLGPGAESARPSAAPDGAAPSDELEPTPETSFEPIDESPRPSTGG
jgi:formate hydrogenlyase subunit 3/multisubunit Na+/H+ antiporter MnhD subunit